MARGSGTVTVKFLGDISDLKKAAGDAEGALGKVGSSIGGMAKTAAMVGIPALVGFGAAAVKQFSESQEVASQTEAVLKSTGGAAKVTADHVNDLAGSLSMLSGTDDEVIQSGENMLLTFTNIRNGVGKGNDIFDQATKTMLDMSTALGQDTKTSAIQLGKALNDPIKGVTALQRVGVSFTDAQKKQIQTLVDSGNTMEAQKIILKELNTEFGGSAKAAGDTFAGSINKLKVIVGNFMEDVGGKLVPIITHFATLVGHDVPRALDAVQPLFTTLKLGVAALTSAFQIGGQSASGGFAGAMSKVGETLRQVWDFLQANVLPVLQRVWSFIQNNLTPILAGLAVIAGAVLLGAVVALAGAIAGLFSPFVLIVGGLAALAAGLSYAYQNSETFRNAVNQLKDVVAAAFGAIQAVVGAGVNFIRGIWRVFGDDLTSFAREGWATIVEVFRGAFETIKGIFDLIKAVFTGKWGDAWNAIKEIVDGAWDTIFGLIRGAVTNVIPTILAGLGQAVSSVMRTAWDGMKQHFKDAINWMIDLYNNFTSHIPSIHLPGTSITVEAPTMKHLARGGTFNGMALVGEEGPELLVGAGRVIPNNQLGGTATFIANFYGPQDPAGVARQLEDLLYRFQQQGGNLRFVP